MGRHRDLLAPDDLTRWDAAALSTGVMPLLQPQNAFTLIARPEEAVEPRSDLVLDPVVTPGVLSAKLWIRRGSGCDQQGQRGGHQLLGSVLSRGCGP